MPRGRGQSLYRLFGHTATPPWWRAHTTSASCHGAPAQRQEAGGGGFIAASSIEASLARGEKTFDFAQAVFRYIEATSPALPLPLARPTYGGRGGAIAILILSRCAPRHTPHAMPHGQGLTPVDFGAASISPLPSLSLRLFSLFSAGDDNVKRAYHARRGMLSMSHEDAIADIIAAPPADFLD